MIPFLRQHKRIVFFLTDLVLLSFSAWLSFFIRFDGFIPNVHFVNLYALIILSLIINLSLFYWQRLYHFTWAYISINDLYRIVKVVTISTLFIALIILVFRNFKFFIGFPRSVILLNYFLTLLMISGIRTAKRLFLEITKKEKEGACRILIIGAGNAGEELARSILKTNNYNLVGFVDDAKTKQNVSIHGKKVLGKRKDLPRIIETDKVEEVIIAISPVDPKIIKETIKICRDQKINKIKIIPSFQRIIDGKISLADIKDVSIEDLLGREAVKIDTEIIKNSIENKKILVTGAAGSIGSHLCQEILKFKPDQLIALDQNETGLFHLERTLNKQFTDIKKSFSISDIRDQDKIDYLLNKYKPEIIFHAAAYKHVPMMEVNPEEAIKNNVFGTLNLGKLAIKHNVQKFVFISTDKAVNPTSIMGASKKVGEMVCLNLNKQTPLDNKNLTGQVSTKFCAVRFGNVLDSQGNVIGIFEEQIKKGGPVEVTHPEMKRYFMITAEACLLVMQAGALSNGGEVFVLDMGQPIKIIDLAKEMIRLAGYQPDIDIPIVFINPRPGEKMFEEINTKQESPTKYEQIFIAKLVSFDENKILKGLEKLKNCLDKNDKNSILKILKELMPNYQPQKYDRK